MPDPRPEHRLMLQTLARIRALLASRAKMRPIEAAGKGDALRAAVADILETYNAAMSEAEVHTLRTDVIKRLRRVYPRVELPPLPRDFTEQVVFRSVDHSVDGRPGPTITGVLRDLYALILPARPAIDPDATLSSGRPAETEVVYPRVAGPQRVEIGDELSVEATYTLHADDAATRPLTAPVGDGRVRVEVVAEATGALALTSPAKRAIEGVAGKAPGGVTFHCRATRGGTGQVHVTFRAGGDTSTVTHSVMVFEAGALTARRREAQSVGRGALYPTLPPAELELTARVLDGAVDIELSGADGILHVDGVATPDDDIAEILRRAIDDGWQHGTRLSSSARERQLGIIGANLAGQLLTRPLIDALQSQPAGHLRLRCTDPSLPWEMLRLGGPDGRPLGEATAVARAPMRGRGGRPHRPGEVVLVSDAGRDVSGEHAALTALGFGEVSVMHGVDAFTARQLDRAPIGVLHFAGRGDAAVDGRGSRALAFDDGRLSPRVIARDPAQSPLAGALVFVDAGRGADADEGAPGLLGHDAWASALLAAGAAAVIAPVCAVDDAEASAFAVAVYGALRDGHPVAEAVRRARCARAEAAPGRFERLAYVVHAPPGVRVSPG